MLRLLSFLRIGFVKFCKYFNFNFFGVIFFFEYFLLFFFNGFGDSEDERILEEFLLLFLLLELNKLLLSVIDLCKLKLLLFLILLLLENFWIDLDDIGESKFGEEGLFFELVMGEFWLLFFWKLIVFFVILYSFDNFLISLLFLLKLLLVLFVILVVFFC